MIAIPLMFTIKIVHRVQQITIERAERTQATGDRDRGVAVFPRI